MRQAFHARLEAVNNLISVAPERVAVFHPVGFPGRPALIRATSAIVDDVWCLVGASHFRRRGMTFDGAVDIASFDQNWSRGYCLKVRAYRQQLMAAKLGIPFPPDGGAASSDWIRLSQPWGAFEMIVDLLDQGGLGRILPFWAGPEDDAVIAASDSLADPDGGYSKGGSVDDLFKKISDLSREFSSGRESGSAPVP